NKADGTFQFGKHEFTAGMTYAQIVEVLQQKTFAEFESFTVTFPEGTTALSMAMTFEKNGVCTVDEFIDACNNHTFDVSFFGEISASPDKFIKLDGFLFPDTYEFAVGAKIDDIILKMLKNFETKVLTPETLELIKSSGMSLEENIILASIVQKESLGGDVYGKVSSIFHNRLKNKEEFPHIESDTSAAHLEYGFIYGVLGLYYNGDIEPMERNIPKNMVAAYDTYTHEGLIVGAICNPGLSAIKGTLLPEDTDYYFFITDVNKKFYWGKTAADHDANIKEVSRVNDAAANAPT
ncbi:MAG: endolytic transglycosylase MltG, partial [Oscillospiraceae bacterium]